VSQEKFKDPEKQDFGRLFLVLAAVLLLIVVWEAYEEAIGRQPWKGYQNDFKRLELEKLSQELAAAQEAFDQKQKRLASAPAYAEPTSVANYHKAISEIEKVLNSPEYKAALEEKARLEQALDELNVEQRFIKADLDAAYYLRDSALEAGLKDHPAPDARGEKLVIETKERLEANKKKVRELAARLKQASEKLGIHEVALARLKRGLDQETSNLVAIKERIKKVECRPPAIQQVVIGGLGEYERVDRCMTCHQGIDRAEFAGSEKLVFRTHSDHERIFKKHPIDRFGCTSCHDGQGRALNEKEAHEGDKHFHSPLLAGAMVEASCARCHDNAPLVTMAPSALEGARLFSERGCVSCHKVEGSPYLTVGVSRLGPDLKAIRGKVSSDWLVSWIQNPRKHSPRTLMPLFGEKGKGLPRDEAVAIASYLSYSSEAPALSGAAKEYESSRRSSAETIRLGKSIFDSKGCLGCHDLGDKLATGPRHVSLDGIGSKAGAAWIYSWIENPAAMSSTTVMPRFQLSREETACLTDYLRSLKSADKDSTGGAATAIAAADHVDRGKGLIKKYGCYSCHDIPGFANSQDRIGPELSDFAAKDETLLFWGDKNVVPAGKRNWTSWTRARLDDPNVFETERIEAIMPHVNLSADETDKILVFLKTLNSERTISKEHRRLLRPGEKELVDGGQILSHYSCLGCHSMYDKEKSIVLAGFQSEPEVRYGKLAPNLSVEGERVRPDWLAEYLSAPYEMRPYLSTSMPAFRFQNKDRQAIVDYFRASANNLSFTGYHEAASLLPVTDSALGQKLVSKRQCVTCHKIGGKEIAPESPINWYRDMKAAARLAPDLSFSDAKLNPAWANAWIANPHAIMPDTTMPHAALTQEEISAIRSFLKNGKLTNQ